jgi:hypothetical protein
VSANERKLTALWCEIETFLARPRVARPLYRADALLDLDQLTANTASPLPGLLAHAIDGWEGRLLLSVADKAPVPEIQAGDRLVIDPEEEANDGSLVVAYAEGTLLVRRLRMRAGRQSLEVDGRAAIPLGPLVAIVGVVVELRRQFS